MSTQTQPQSRLSTEGYQTMIDRLNEREKSGLFGSRREPSRNYLSEEGYNRMIAHVSSRQSRGLAQSVATGYNGVRTVVADTGKVMGAVYNGGARVVKGLAVGAAKTIGTAWNAGVDVHKYMREVRAAKANAKRTQEMHDTQVMALMAQIIKTLKDDPEPPNGGMGGMPPWFNPYYAAAYGGMPGSWGGQQQGPQPGSQPGSQTAPGAGNP